MKTGAARFRQAVCVGLALASMPAAVALNRSVSVPGEFAWLFPMLGLLGMILFLSLAFRGRLEEPPVISSSGAPRADDSRPCESISSPESPQVDPEATRRMALPAEIDALRRRPLPTPGRSQGSRPAPESKSAPASIRLDPKDSWRVSVTRRSDPKTASSEDPDATIRLNG